LPQQCQPYEATWVAPMGLGGGRWNPADVAQGRGVGEQAGGPTWVDVRDSPPEPAPFPQRSHANAAYEHACEGAHTRWVRHFRPPRAPACTPDCGCTPQGVAMQAGRCEVCAANHTLTRPPCFDSQPSWPRTKAHIAVIRIQGFPPRIATRRWTRGDMTPPKPPAINHQERLCLALHAKALRWGGKPACGVLLCPRSVLCWVCCVG
jgi:hypothetical protein